MENTKFFLTYCSDNQLAIQNFINDLGRVNIGFVHDTRQLSERSQIEKQLYTSNAPIFLFITDNFLKSKDCMRDVLDFLRNPRLQQRIHPIIMEGTEVVDGAYQDIPTKFERVSDVIRYINHWQKHYQGLRNAYRTASNTEKAAIDSEINEVRHISNTVIGKLLNALKVTNRVSFESLKAKSFKRAFDTLGSQGVVLHEKYKLLPAYVAPIFEPVLEEVEEIEAFSVINTDNIEPVDINSSYSLSNGMDSKINEIIEENVELPITEIIESIEETAEETVEVPQLDLDIQDIPGLHLLPNLTEEKQEDEAESGSDEESPINEVIDEFDEKSILIEDTNEVFGEMPLSDETPKSNEMENAIVEISEQIEEEVEDDIEEEDDIDAIGSSALEATTKDSENLLDVADAFIESGDYNAAQDTYIALLIEQPHNGTVHYQYAILLQDHLQNFRLANAHLEKAAGLHPNNEDAFMRLATIAENEADYLLAKRYYEKIILLNLDNEQAYYKLGVLLVEHTNNQEFVAASYFQRALTLDKEYSEAHFEYGKLLQHYFKKYKKAEKHYKKALKNSDEEAKVSMELAGLYLNNLAKKKKGQKFFEKAIELDARHGTDDNYARFGIERVIEEIETKLQLGQSGLEESAEPPKPTKTVFITGATSGIGKATSALFAQYGYKIIITGRRVERLEALRDYLTTEYNATVLPLAFDVRDQKKVAEIINNLPESWRSIDVLVNNAGLAKGFTPINEGELWHWEAMIDTNLKGLLYITRTIAPLMVERQTGHIINIGSIAGKEVYPNGNVYCATKSAVDALTKGMRIDLHKHNIRVTGIHPGHVETEFALVRFDGDEEKSKIYDDFQPLKAADVADTIYYVASRPAHVNIEDIVMWGTQQASATIIDRSGRDRFVLNKKEE